jgi:N-acetylmuramic acid 6-phosphate (MurNAc-6-P) etherase
LLIIRLLLGEEIIEMNELINDELIKKVLEYLATVDKTKNRDVARAINEDKSRVDKAIAQLANEGKIEYLYLGTSYIRLKDK